MDTTHPPKYSRKQLWVAWAVVSLCLAYAAMGVWSRSCACGYKTMSGIGTSTAVAASAWVGLIFARRSPIPARVALAAWTLITSLLFARHVAEAFFFSPHAPFR